MRSHTTSTDPEASTDPVAMTSPEASIDPTLDSDARIARLFEMTSDLLATISLDGRFTLLNPAWEQVLGWTREELQAQADAGAHAPGRRRADGGAPARR